MNDKYYNADLSILSPPLLSYISVWWFVCVCTWIHTSSTMLNGNKDNLEFHSVQYNWDQHHHYAPSCLHHSLMMSVITGYLLMGWLLLICGGSGSRMVAEVAVGGGVGVQGCGEDHFLSSRMLLGSEKGPSRLLVSTARTAKWYTCPGMNYRREQERGTTRVSVVFVLSL